VEALARHLKDPASFWRHHPIPSLAADSPHYVTGGAYWLGSTWAPTNYASIKGFFRAGRQDLAREAALLHLQRLSEVLQATGHLWENYCADRSERGSQSGPDYSWTALGPIALLMEVVIGIEADALHNTLHWHLPEEEQIGVDNLAFGQATVSLRAIRRDNARLIEVSTDRPFTLDIIFGNSREVLPCIPGRNTFALQDAK
jgi:hypothetical protein